MEAEIAPYKQGFDGSSFFLLPYRLLKATPDSITICAHFLARTFSESKEYACM